ncbi:class I SAM-dependent methyltransferase [bacterium]|nr:class I SAM-dependent methyltransferase [bacterium]
MIIQEEFNRRKQTPTDINEHLETLFNYGSNCETITEFGSRYGDSTVALLNSNPKAMVSYDLFKSDFINTIHNDNYKFVLGDSLEVNIEETDLLFIDTLHRYFQLFNELGLHAKKVRKYIILHDTVSFGYSEEPLYGDNDPVKMSGKVIATKKQGLKQALHDFLNETKEGKNWTVHEEFTHNNGLTILTRV